MARQFLLTMGESSGQHASTCVIIYITETFIDSYCAPYSCDVCLHYDRIMNPDTSICRNGTISGSLYYSFGA